MKQKCNTFFEIHERGFRLLKIVHGLNRHIIPGSMLIAVLRSVIPYISIVLSAVIVDLLLVGNYEKAVHVVLLMCGLTAIAEILLQVLTYHMGVFRNKLDHQAKKKIREKAMDLDYASMDDPEILNVIRNTESAANYNGGLIDLVLEYQSMFQYLLSSVAATAFTLELCIAMPQKASGMLGFFAHPAMTILVLVTAWLIGVKLIKTQEKEIKKIDDLIAEEHYGAEGYVQYWVFRTIDNVSVGKTMRVGGIADMVLENTKYWLGKARPCFVQMGISDRKKIISEGVESGLFSVAAYFLVLVKVITEAITIGAFTKYAGALLQLNQAVSKLVWSENEINRLTKNLIRFDDFLCLESQMETGSIHVEKRLDNHYEIEFHDVGFQYAGSENFVLRHVNAKINLKNKLAVVGKNGAGKSTFIKLLCRLYDPTEGVITLNGIDIRKYDYEEYLSLFGVVFQDFHLFGYSIAKNVAASDTFEEAKVRHCLEQAGILEFVDTLPKGIHTVIELGEEDGVNLSGGEAQKISIARALYKDAPFVILDEPTAALDPISEAEIYERFDEMVDDKTSIYISHRMSSCRFCHEIMVFEEGRIRERGSHDELLALGGSYAALWSAQAKYYA